MIYTISCTNYRYRHHNLGDFIYILCLRNFIKKHNIDSNYVRRDKIDRFDFKDNDVMIMSGFFSTVETSNTKFWNNKKDVYNYIGFHCSNKIKDLRTNKRFGCRDFKTYELFKDQCPNSYVSLCPSLMANLLDFSNINQKNDKIIFIDCGNNFVKSHSEKNSVSLTQLVHHHNRTELEMESVAYNRLKYLKENAKIVYTSRLHIYLPCIAMGIPVKYVGKIDGRTAIVKIINKQTIKYIQPLLIQNFEHEIFGNGSDVHNELHNLCNKLFNRC